MREISANKVNLFFCLELKENLMGLNIRSEKHLIKRLSIMCELNIK